MNCPRCNSGQHTKCGIINSRQRFKCRDCGYHFTVEKRSTEYPKSLRKKALQLYLEGLGFRSIGRILEVSNVTVLKWIRSFGEQVAALRSQTEDIQVVELDEMRGYVGNKKNYCRIWIVVDRFGKKFINFIVGDRSDATAKQLWKEIKHHQMNYIASGYWLAYEKIVPKGKHIQSKAATFTVEGYNSLFRHFLARMRRKSKCYSKCMKMLQLSILLLMSHRNGTLSILS